MLGGALAVLDLLAAALLVLMRPCCKSCEAKANAAAAGSGGTDVKELDGAVP
jgi:hypothetical protein